MSHWCRHHHFHLLNAPEIFTFTSHQRNIFWSSWMLTKEPTTCQNKWRINNHGVPSPRLKSVAQSCNVRPKGHCGRGQTTAVLYKARVLLPQMQIPSLLTQDLQRPKLSIYQHVWRKTSLVFYLLDEILFLLKVEETGSWYGKFFDLCVVLIS